MSNMQSLPLYHCLSSSSLSRYSHGLYKAILSLSLTTYVFVSFFYICIYIRISQSLSLSLCLCLSFATRRYRRKRLCFFFRAKQNYIFSNIKYTIILPCGLGLYIALVIFLLYFSLYYRFILAFIRYDDDALQTMLLLLFFEKFRVNIALNSSRITNKMLHIYFASDLFSFFLRDFFLLFHFTSLLLLLAVLLCYLNIIYNIELSGMRQTLK